MRKFIMSMFCCVGFIFCYGQAKQQREDSLRQLIVESKKEDTNKVKQLLKLSQISYPETDTCYHYATAAIQLSQKLNYQYGETNGLAILGDLNENIGNFPKALGLYLQSLKIIEQTQDTSAIEHALINLGSFYYFQKDYKTAINYYKKALELSQRNWPDTFQTLQSLSDMGDMYFKLNILDSASYYSELVYQKAMNTKFERLLLPDPLTNLGDVYSKLNKPSLTLGYYRIALPAATANQDVENLCESALGMAKIFQEQNKNDSALFYARKSFDAAISNNNTWRQVEAGNFITANYEMQKNTDSAFKYLKLTSSLKDSLYSQEKLKSVQDMTTSENIRQQEIAEQRRQYEEEAKRNLQRTAIAVFIPAFFLLVLLLSRTKVRGRTIEFLAIVGLLLFFEFITDLLYPYVSDWTNESPLWETLIFVVLAACLEPISHKLEHWIKMKLSHKIHHASKHT